jgi:nucleoside-diphosphate-sugar epimerase
MKVLVLGGSGYIGSRLCTMLADSGWATPVSASSRREAPGVENLRIDTTAAASVTRAVQGMDAVVNCVAGSARAIAEGAKVLAEACAKADCARFVHLSSMAVYGAREGLVGERSPLDPALGWYARAKCDAEEHVASFAKSGGRAVILRPGCVWGPGSELWVGRIGRYLHARRLGDLGAGGDGWSNLVHVDDVCNAIAAALHMAQPAGQIRTYNLAAPDSPRWNEYFIDLALAIGATPVRRISPGQLRLDAWVAGPTLKIAQAALARAGLPARALPDPLPPGLLGLWQRQLRLDPGSAQRDLDIRWTAYGSTLQEAAKWFLDKQDPGRRVSMIASTPRPDTGCHTRSG